MPASNPSWANGLSRSHDDDGRRTHQVSFPGTLMPPAVTA
jgi:hypothetical protein